MLLEKLGIVRRKADDAPGRLFMLMRSPGGSHLAVWVKDGEMRQEEVGRKRFDALFEQHQDALGYIEGGIDLELTAIYSTL